MSLFEIIAVSFTAIYFLTYYKEKKLKEDKYNENV